MLPLTAEPPYAGQSRACETSPPTPPKRAASSTYPVPRLPTASTKRPTRAGESEPRSRSSALSCCQLLGAKKSVRTSCGESASTESEPWFCPLVSVPLPTDTSSRPPSTTGPPLAQMPPSRLVGTVYERIGPAPVAGTDSTVPV